MIRPKTNTWSPASNVWSPLVSSEKTASPASAGIERGGVAEDADFVLAGAVPVADDDAVGGQAEGEGLVAGVHDVVAVGVEDELAGDAVGGGAEDADVGHAVAVPVADDGLVAGLAER